MRKKAIFNNLRNCFSKKTEMTFFNRILLLLLTVLGFSTACEEKMTCAYGTPTANYEFSGLVKDKDGNAIKGIEVRSYVNGNYSESGKSPLSEEIFSSDNGEFVINDKGFPLNQKVEFVFKDVDGEANGSFKEATVEFELKDIMFTEPTKKEKKENSWYNGKYSKVGIDVVLEKGNDK